METMSYSSSNERSAVFSFSEHFSDDDLRVLDGFCCVGNEICWSDLSLSKSKEADGSSKGAFSQFHRCRYKGKPVGVKEGREVGDGEEEEAEKQSLMFAMEALTNLNLTRNEKETNNKSERGGISQLVACSLQSTRIPFLVFELGELGDMADVLSLFKMAGKPEMMAEVRGGALANPPLLPLPILVGWMLDAACGLAKMHDKDILHKDLKLHNMFVRGTGHLVVGDFGLSGGEEVNRHVGNKLHQDPDVSIKGHSKHSDVYSYASTFVRIWMLDGEEKQRDPPAQLLELVKESLPASPRTPSLSSSPHEKLFRLLQRCINTEHKMRPTMEDVKKELENMCQDSKTHPFFETQNWKKDSFATLRKVANERLVKGSSDTALPLLHLITCLGVEPCDDLVEVIVNKAICLMECGDFNSAFATLMEGARMARKKKNVYWEVHIRGVIVSLYTKQDDNNQALKEGNAIITKTKNLFPGELERLNIQRYIPWLQLGVVSSRVGYARRDPHILKRAVWYLNHYVIYDGEPTTQIPMLANLRTTYRRLGQVKPALDAISKAYQLALTVPNKHCQIFFDVSLSYFESQLIYNYWNCNRETILKEMEEVVSRGIAFVGEGNEAALQYSRRLKCCQAISPTTGKVEWKKVFKPYNILSEEVDEYYKHQLKEHGENHIYENMITFLSKVATPWN